MLSLLHDAVVFTGGIAIATMALWYRYRFK
jgi:hypothetical protein